MLKRLLRRPRVQASLAWLLARYLDFALRTTRWTLHGEAHLAPFVLQPAVGAFWHERLPLMPAMWRMVLARSGGQARARVLVSRHSDGRFIANVMRRFDIGVVHGSTARNGEDRGGATGVRALLALMDAGDHVVITPDGPRGPRRVPAPGVAQISAISGVPVVPCAAQTTHRWTLGTWDRMVLPLPWGRGAIVCGPPIAVPREEWSATLPAIAAAISAATDEADRLCS
jgi:hypothetical protein